MALVKQNDLTEGLSGAFGKKFIFRVVKGVTQATRRPTFKKPPTAKQLAHRERFRRATLYAKAKMLDPVAKEHYRKMAGDKAFANAFAAAVKDYLLRLETQNMKADQLVATEGSTVLAVIPANSKAFPFKNAWIVSSGRPKESSDVSLLKLQNAGLHQPGKQLGSQHSPKLTLSAMDLLSNKPSLRNGFDYSP